MTDFVKCRAIMKKCVELETGSSIVVQDRGRDAINLHKRREWCSTRKPFRFYISANKPMPIYSYGNGLIVHSYLKGIFADTNPHDYSHYAYRVYV